MTNVLVRSRPGLAVVLMAWILMLSTSSGLAQDSTPVASTEIADTGPGNPPAESPTATPPPSEAPESTASPTSEAASPPAEPTSTLEADATPTVTLSPDGFSSFAIQAAAATLVTPEDPTVVQATCVAGVIHSPTVTFAITPGVQYQSSSTPVAGGDYFLIASLQDGYDWGDLPDNWTFIGAFGIASSNITLDPTPACTDVIPVAPTVFQATCIAGVFAAPSITLPADTDVIAYTRSGQATVGRSVLVTAELVRDADTWGTLPAGWTRQGEFAVLVVGPLGRAACSPVEPAITPATCRDGVGVFASASAPSNTNAISYSLQRQGGTAIVFATLQPATSVWIDPLPGDWVTVNETLAMRVIDGLNADPCVRTNLVSAAFFQSTVESVEIGEVFDLVPIVPASPGIAYTVSGIGGGVFTVTAELIDGYDWPDDLPAGWIEIDEDTAIYRFTLTVDPAGNSDPEPPTPTGGATSGPAVLVTALPVTGTGPSNAFLPTAPMLLLVSLLMAVSGVALRRRSG